MPLHYAAREGDLQGAEWLLGNNAPVDARANDGQTALHYAARKGYLDVVKLLVQSGTDVNAKSNDGLTPIQWAAAKANLDVVTFLENAEMERAAPMSERDATS